MVVIALFLAMLTAGEPAAFGNLWPVDRRETTRIVGTESMPYAPQEGDLVVYTSHKPWQACLYFLARTGEPFHAGLVTRDPDGSLKMFEAGPVGYKSVVRLDLVERFRTHLTDSNQGVIWVRRLRSPLTAEQSAALTRFTLQQEGKPFAGPRLAWHATPFNERSQFLCKLVPDAKPTQRNWFCSELVVEAMRAAGTIPANAPPGNAIMPDQLYADRQINLIRTYQPPMRWTFGTTPVSPKGSADDARAIPRTQCECEPR